MNKSDVIERLEAEAAALREALEALLSAGESGMMADWYPARDQAYAVLAADAGRALLERLRRAEHERDE